jgi:hybrid polyketide synthase/nonribosomal peptide synthetase ACE1
LLLTFYRDIANKEDLQRVYDEISSTLPPIAGVANAAMVLHDMEFAQMPLDMMKRVWAPKIDGSNYLDELFYNHDLEFFVLFSSLSFVYGNTGQASYASANGYLNSLVSQRRKRGSAASVIDISQLAGMGYVERTGHVLQDRLLRYGFMRISESDFHEMIAETIRAGRPKSKSSPVVTIGVRAARDDEEVKVPWFANPRLSHFIVEANTSNVKATGKKINLPVSDQLRSATNEDGILEILRSTDKLC